MQDHFQNSQGGQLGVAIATPLHAVAVHAVLSLTPLLDGYGKLVQGCCLAAQDCVHSGCEGLCSSAQASSNFNSKHKLRKRIRIRM